MTKRASIGNKYILGMAMGNNRLFGYSSDDDLLYEEKYKRVTGTDISITDSKRDKGKIRGFKCNSYQNNLPPIYTQVDYIQSTGTQYINTGYIANQNTKVETNFMYDTLNFNYLFVFGGRVSATSRRCCFGIEAANIMYFQFGTGTTTGQVTSDTLSTGIKYKVIMYKESYALDDVVKLNYTTVDFTTSVPVYLFANNNNGSLDRPFKGKIYNFKIWESGVLNRNFIPCFRNSDGVIGMYETVYGIFYTNNGTGTFAKGSNIIPSFDNQIPFKSTGDTTNLKIASNKLNILPKLGLATPSSDTTFWASKSSRITDLEDGWVRVTNDNSQGGSILYTNFFIKKGAIPTLKPDTDYTFVLEARNKIGTMGSILLVTNSSLGEKDSFASSAASTWASLTTLQKFKVKTRSDITNISGYAMRGYFSSSAGQNGSAEIRLMIIEGDYTNTEISYEPYVGSVLDVALPNKNMFNGTFEQGTLASENGLPSTSSTRIRTINYLNLNPSTQYTANFAGLNTVVVAQYDKDYNFLSSSNWTLVPYTFTSNVNAKYYKLIARKDGGTIVVTPTDISNVQLEYGAATSYYPYIDYVGGSLPNGVADTDTQMKMGRIVLNGSENWSTQWNTGLYGYRLTIGNIKVWPDLISVSNIISNKCVTYGQTALFNLPSPGYGICSRGSQSQIIIRNDNLTTVNDFKAFLTAQYNAGTPVIVYYELATPVDVITQLPDVDTYDGTNIITSTNNVKPNLIVDYLEK